jgi:hypothetical protein
VTSAIKVPHQTCKLPLLVFPERNPAPLHPPLLFLLFLLLLFLLLLFACAPLRLQAAAPNTALARRSPQQLQHCLLFSLFLHLQHCLLASASTANHVCKNQKSSHAHLTAAQARLTYIRDC